MDDSGHYTLNCTGEARILCYAHYRREGKTACRSRPYALLVENGKTEIPYALFKKAGYESFDVAFDVKSLKGSITVIPVLINTH